MSEIMELIRASAQRSRVPDSAENFRPCSACGCAIVWQDAYGGWHCGQCQPPATDGMSRQRMALGPDGPLDPQPSGYGPPRPRSQDASQDDIPAGWHESAWRDRTRGGIMARGLVRDGEIEPGEWYVTRWGAMPMAAAGAAEDAK